MDKQLIGVKAELQELGFCFSEENIAVGRVPRNGKENGYYIDVEISLEDYPLKQPSIKLISINGDSDLHKVIPANWRHIDEFLIDNPKKSNFLICCLHNWSAKIEYNGNYIYQRILDWLQSNVNQDWKKEEDLVSWRILPQFTQLVMYLPKGFINHFESIEIKKLYKTTVDHTPFLFKNGKEASTKKRGETYEYESIDSNKPYFFFPDFNEDSSFNILKQFRLPNKHSKSTLFLVRLPKGFSFKTLYQLIQTLRNNFPISSIDKDIKSLIFLVMYKGDRGKTEVTSFITGRESFERDSEYNVTNIKIESIPERPNGIDMTVGMIGVGSLGSQVARLLAEKDVKALLMADYDKMALENLGRHVLGSIHVGGYKSIALKQLLSNYYLHENIFAKANDDEVIELADVLIVTVGDSSRFDYFAFNKLINYKKPVIWAWTSANNILQEIVITTPSTGCLNCYYLEAKENKDLKQIQELSQKEIEKYDTNEIDICGNPHTISQMERMVFLATQIVSILSFYNKHGKFKFDYVNYYWGMDDIIPTPLIGYLEKSHLCFCERESI